MSDLQCAARLLLARDGEAQIDTGSSESGGSLSLTGREQAAALAESLEDARVAVIYCSSRAPAVQTAEIVAARLGVVVRVRDSLRELSAEDELGAVVDLHRGESVLVVTDGDAIRRGVPRLARNLPDSYGNAHEVDQCAVVEVDADADGWVVRSWGGDPVWSDAAE